MSSQTAVVSLFGQTDTYAQVGDSINKAFEIQICHPSELLAFLPNSL